ncbi:hypothetical protein GQ44DRAFT_787729 [Phaeosphaeriaceae sp. PMI808]|nr:hypothetical protein GQ44DRAFT_787729 [Phaeosphaeriaceae sp. PMI808]
MQRRGRMRYPGDRHYIIAAAAAGVTDGGPAYWWAADDEHECENDELSTRDQYSPPNFTDSWWVNHAESTQTARGSQLQQTQAKEQTRSGEMASLDVGGAKTERKKQDSGAVVEEKKDDQKEDQKTDRKGDQKGDQKGDKPQKEQTKDADMTW